MRLPADFVLPPGTTFGPPPVLPGAAPAKVTTRRAPAMVEAAVTALEFTAPVVLASEANKRDHWTARRRRFQAQRLALTVALDRCRFHCDMIPRRPVTVTLTKLGGKKLDPDNLAGSFKCVQDYMAAWYGCDDGDESAVEWRYDQRPGGPVGIRVRVESREG